MDARWIAIPLFLAQGASPAEAFGIDRLMQQLADRPAAEVAYVETKHSALLAEPLVSSGTLAYRRPDVVEKVVASPRRESFRIAGGELTVTRDGRSRRVLLASEPLLAAFAASLQGVLSGNAALLGEHYRLALEGSERGWTLELAPLDPEIGRFVERIVVSGRSGQVGRIEVREASGDRSVLTVK